MRYRYRLETPPPSNNKKYMIIGFVVALVVAIIAITVYIYRKKGSSGSGSISSDPLKKDSDSTSSDPLNKTVSVNTAIARIPMPPASELLTNIASASPKTTFVRSSSDSSTLNSVLGGPMELYTLLTYNLPESFVTKLIPCYEESTTNPRLALNATKQIAKMISVVMIDSLNATHLYGSFQAPYPGLPTPRGFLSNEDLSQFMDKLYIKGVKTTYYLLPNLIQFMLENDYTSADQVLTYIPSTSDASIDKIIIKSQAFLDIMNYVLPISKSSDLYYADLPSSVELDQPYDFWVVAVVFNPYYSVLRMRDNTYTPFNCSLSIQQTLQDDIRAVFTRESVQEAKDRGAILR